MGKYLVEKISGKPVEWHNPKKRSWFAKKQVFASIGSILGHTKPGWTVWGSGIISKNDAVANCDFLAVRGPQSRAYLLNLGYQVPEVYGDPALLLPNYYSPSVTKNYTIGIIPHINDYKQINALYQSDAAITVIDLLTNDIETTTQRMLECEAIISSSLHGVIVAHAYGIPAVWIQFSDKVFGDGIKYQDYFESVGIPSYVPKVYTEKLSVSEGKAYIASLPSLPDSDVIEKLKKGLLAVCPFTPNTK